MRSALLALGLALAAATEAAEPAWPVIWANGSDRVVEEPLPSGCFTELHLDLAGPAVR